MWSIEHNYRPNLTIIIPLCGGLGVGKISQTLTTFSGASLYNVNAPSSVRNADADCGMDPGLRQND